VATFTNCRNIILSVAAGLQNKETASSSFANCASVLFSLEASYPNFFILTDPLVQRGDVSVRFTTNSHLCEKVLGPVPVPIGRAISSSVYHHLGHGVVEAKSKSSVRLETPCLFLASNDQETHPAAVGRSHLLEEVEIFFTYREFVSRFLSS
jgi:hypothetical protein